MEVVVGPEHCSPVPGGAAVTIGAYDGVHLGHQYLLRELNERADSLGLSTEVVTFDRHPATVVRPESAPQQLTDIAQKLDLLAKCAVDRVVVVPFDSVRAAESAEDFVNEVLVGSVGARLVVVGSDFHFGNMRRGNVSLLEEMGDKLGFEVIGVKLEHDPNGIPVSSTRIRELLAVGRVAEAARLLGRFHELRGTVERGDSRGGPELGFPTANVAVPRGMATPKEGIYAAWYFRPDGSRHAAAVSFGRRPTFEPEGTPPLLEAHLIDFAGDLYGELGRVAFVDRLRDELRFDSVDDLVAQMSRDVEATRIVLEGAESHGGEA
jgi:riboflavin kinase/FMN adenylyltransferase